MHELQRRQLVRIAFVLACVLPTLLVIGFVIRMRLPSYATSYAEAIAHATETTVRIDQVSHPKPHVTRFANFQVFAMDTHNLLLQANQLDIVHTNLGYEVRGDLELHADATTLWSIIERQLRKHQQVLSPKRFTVRSECFVWRSDSTVQSFRDIRCDFRSTADGDSMPNGTGATFACSYRNAENEQAEAGTLAVKRIVVGGRSHATLVARTHNNAIKPAILFPGWQPYCGDATLLGELNAICESGKWRGIAKSIHWQGLSGSNLVGEQLLPLRLTGMFDLANATCEFTHQRITKASGELACKEAQLSDALVRQLEIAGFRIARSKSAANRVRVSRSRFSLDSDGCRIQGLCESPNVATRPVAIGKSLRIDAPPSVLRIDNVVSILASPHNERAMSLVEGLRRRLPLDRLRFADQSP